MFKIISPLIILLIFSPLAMAQEPLPKFYFTVSGPGFSTTAQEVDGLESEVQEIEYRQSNSPNFYPIKMLGIGQVGNITLRKMVVTNDADFWDYYDKTNNPHNHKRATYTIQLIDESGEPKMKWTLQNAWPTKITGTNLHGDDGNQVNIDRMELAYESLSVEAE